MQSISLPNKVEDLLGVLSDLARRAVDGTVTPLFVDSANQRVIVGATTVSSGTAGKVEVAGDIKITSAASGIILTDSNGVEYRLIADVDGALRLNQL